jgi:CubicO group peptidase (beta-lactamase class C family)
LNRIATVENNLLRAVSIQDNHSPAITLTSQMQALNVPGVSIAVINDGEIAWAKGYGFKKTGADAPVTTETLFQACSISKAVTGAAVMLLVQRGLLGLDEDVNGYLTSWQVPENEFTQKKKVTLRRLLTHSAGLSLVGFPGHTRGGPVATVTQILDGIPPSNTGPVRVFIEPGTRYVYSGGGYTVIQQLMVDVTGKDFHDLLSELLFEPLSMQDSTFEQPLPQERWGQAAAGHTVDGDVMAGDWHVFPALAAAGLWTTPSDLARFAIGVQQAAAGLNNKVWSQETVRQMTSAHFANWGLGPGTGGEGEDAYFFHSGGNLGYRCEMTAFLYRGQGAVVMTNGDNGTNLSMQVIRAAAQAYDWPHYCPVTKTVLDLDLPAAEKLAGIYRSTDDPETQVELLLEDGRLFWVIPMLFPPKFQILPEAEDIFFDPENGYRFLFTKEANGRITVEAYMFDVVFRSEKVG